MAEDVTITMRLQGALKTAAETRKVAGEFDNLGDKAQRAGRKIAKLNAASKDTRVNLGPFSTTARGGVLALGAFANAAGPATAGVIGLTEALGTAAGGAGAAGGVGLLAFGQGMGVAKLATQGLTQALSGNKKALARLSPQQREFLDQLNAMRPMFDRLRGNAAGGLLGGLAGGAHAAAANFGIVNRIVKQTSGTLGGLARDAGGVLGSKAFGADLATLGATNVRIIDNLGHAAIHLAGAARHVLVEAGPLAEWLSRMALRGAKLTEVWAANQRATGGLSRFFQRARRDLAELGSIFGHTGRGIINLFGADDANGTHTLQALDRLTGRFERWTRGPALKHGIGNAIVDGIAASGGAIANVLAHALVPAGITGGKLFVKAFFSADVWGKALIAGLIAKKLGAFGAVGKILAGGAGGKAGKAGGALGGLLERGASPARPLFVVDIGSHGGKSWLERNVPKAAGGGGLAAGAAAGATVGAAALYAAAKSRAARRAGIHSVHPAGVPIASGTIGDAQGNTALINSLLGSLGIHFGHHPAPNRSRQGLNQADPFGRPLVIEDHSTIELRVGDQMLSRTIHKADRRHRARTK